MSSSEIRKQIRETRKEMKAKGIRRIACFNGGLSGEVYSLNAKMFRLELALGDAIKAERIQRIDETTLWDIATGR
jgi:hypothetical protein